MTIDSIFVSLSFLSLFLSVCAVTSKYVIHWKTWSFLQDLLWCYALFLLWSLVIHGIFLFNGAVIPITSFFSLTEVSSFRFIIFQNMQHTIHMRLSLFIWSERERKNIESNENISGLANTLARRLIQQQHHPQSKQRLTLGVCCIRSDW
jgi:hypothetical protein